MPADTCPPQWSSAVGLVVEIVSVHSVTITWPGAEDDVEVTDYIVFHNFAPVAKLNVSTTMHVVAGLRCK